MGLPVGNSKAASAAPDGDEGEDDGNEDKGGEAEGHRGRDEDEEDEEGFEGEEDDEKEENDLAGIDPFDLSLARFIEAGGQELGPQTDPLSVKERHARFKIIPRIEVGPW